MWRKLLRGLGCFGYLGVLGVVFALIAYVAFSLFVRGGVTATPDLRRMAEAEAVALLTDQGLKAVWSEDTRYDEEVPKGNVVMQTPRPGVYVKRNTEVVLTLSKGQKRIAIPDLQGQAVQAALVGLDAAGLRIGRTINIYSAKERAGVVVDQWPAAGSKAAQDASVDLFLSIGNTVDVFVMPDLTDLNYEDVRAVFERHGIRIGKVRYYDDYAQVEPGTILAFHPKAGHPVRRDEAISLTVVPPRELNTVAGPQTQDPSSP